MHLGAVLVSAEPRDVALGHRSVRGRLNTGLRAFPGNTAVFHAPEYTIKSQQGKQSVLCLGVQISQLVEQGVVAKRSLWQVDLRFRISLEMRIVRL